MADSGSRTGLSEKIARLRASFVASLPERVTQMRRLAAELAAQPQEAALLGELHRCMHSVKGTAASFGFADLSATAAEAEAFSRHLRDGADGLTPGATERLGALIDALERESVADAGAPAGRGETSIFALPPETAEHGAEQSDQRLIYLCDDEPQEVEYLSAQLACFGYRTETFADPKALCAAVSERRPGMVIMDIIFPEGEDHGLETIGGLQREHNPPLPVIFISGRRDFDARLRAVQAGGSAYFPKPVKAIELVETLDALTATGEPEPYRILIIDDEPQVAEYHAAILREAGMIALILHEPYEVLAMLTEFKPDLVLMDMYMPECNGRELAQVIRQVPAFLSLPIVYLSSETDMAKQFSAMGVGADGFLTKPIQPERLVPAVGLRAERMRALRSLMVRDSLTGLFNHTTTKQFLANTASQARRRGERFCFAMIDVDHFKAVNDTYGHPVGDQVLLALSRLLQQRLRHSDVVGRYGGEEFAVILLNLGPEEAAGVLDGLREDFAQIRFTAEGGDFSSSFSCGVAAYPDFDSADALNQAADSALYAAKHRGRNRVVVSGASAGSEHE